MAKKVVHVDEGTHQRAKKYCETHNIHMSKWVSGLITNALAASAFNHEVVPRGKKLTILNGPESTDVGLEPPFWSVREQE